MEHMNAETRAEQATDPELDEALARAIRQLIAEAIESGSVSDNGAGPSRAAA
jgi:hypothetical protein